MFEPEFPKRPVAVSVGSYNYCTTRNSSIEKLLMFHNNCHGIAPHYLQELLLPFYRPTHSYNLKNADNLNFVIPQTNTVSYYNSFFLQSAIQLWNGLPLETKCIESFHTFKNELKKPTEERTKNVKFFNYGSRRENITVNLVMNLET